MESKSCVVEQTDSTRLPSTNRIVLQHCPKINWVLRRVTQFAAPRSPFLHSKLGFLLLITESLHRGKTFDGGKGGGRKLKFFLLKSAKRHKGPLRQSFSDNSFYCRF